MAADGGGQSADAGLDEDVRGRVAELAERLVDHHGIALHHVARNLGVAGIGRVGDHDPAVRVRVGRRLSHGIVIGTRHAADFGSIGRNRICATFADGRVDIDDAFAAETMGTPRD